MDVTKKKRPKSSKSATSERPKSKTGISPYSQNYRAPIPHCQKHLIAMHLTVTKLSRSDLEDKYLQLCDENYQIKHENKELTDKLKLLSTKIMRVSSASLTIRRFKSVDMISQGSSNRENHEDCDDGAIQDGTGSGKSKKINSSTNKTLKRPALKAKNELDREQFLDGVWNVIQGGSQDIPGSKKTNMKAEKQSYIDLIAELQQELEMKKEEYDDLKNKSFDLEVKLKELDANMFEETKKLVAANMEIKSVKRKAEKYELQVKHLKQERRELEKKLEATIENDKKRMEELKSTLDEEKIKIERLVEQNEELESNRKQILLLKEQIIQLESEKSSLRVQQENFTKLIDESASYKATLDELLSQNEKLRKDISHEKSEQQVIFHSQELLLGKLQKLQDENDSLTVENEGLKSKLEYYTNENISLELRLRDVEQNKYELMERLKKLESGIKGKSGKENMKEKVLNKLSTVTFEPWESDIVKAKHRSRTDSISSRTSNGSNTSKQQKSLDKSDSFPSISDKTPVVSLQVPTPTRSHHSPKKLNEKKEQKRQQEFSEITAISENKIDDSQFSRDLSLIQKAMTNNHTKSSYLKVDFTLDDVTLTEDFTDMTPTRDSGHDMSMHADRAANLLIKDIKKSVGFAKSDTKKI
uniref:CSON012004 protein n=1 Tax=Culicoides sonorensis TaxID=179676 RepID=A0A336LQA3_CULSO